MAPHSNTFAWKIPWMEEPGRLQSQMVAPQKLISGHVFLEEIIYTIVVVLGRRSGEGIGYPLHCSWATPVAQLVKNLPAMQETWV